MLYPKNREDRLSAGLFRDPAAEYRCTPFWAWNCDLDDGLLNREIDYMKEMGMGGFHMHTRPGMSVPYLSDEFMGRVRACVEEARKQHMLAWLYDEDKWPSGFAGGYVTEKPENRQRFLLFTPRTQEEDPAGDVRLLARYAVRLDHRGVLADYARIGEEDEPKGTMWYAYLKRTPPTPWFHFRGYVDTMNPVAIRDFIQITHERYRSALGEDFGTLCPAIFTDEPQMPRKTTLSHATDLQDVVLPWTDDLEETYTAAYGESLLDHLPEVVWEIPEGVSLTRYHYHDHTTERFVSAFCDQIGTWCRNNGILMTGHMMEEPTLDTQTKAIGEAMRAYRAFTLPGVDLLCDHHEYNTLKQAASAAHQQGCPGVTSELYGVTNWDFDFKGHKLQGDWQAALGVSVRVPHLYWYTMHGESKRDYPASIGHQSPWWKEYTMIENHFARVNTLMTRGKPHVRIGVIHPIESCWIAFGPNDQTGVRRAELNRRFAEIAEWMLFDTLDFDWICESTLPELHKEGDGFIIGEMTYDAVVVPAPDTMRRTTLDALRAYRKKGGQVIFLGDAPKYIDAIPCNDAADFSRECLTLPWDRAALNDALEPLREIRIETPNGLPSDNLICALRRDGESRNLLITHVMPTPRLAPSKPESYRILLKGAWQAELWDTMTGDIRPWPTEAGDGTTALDWNCWGQDSLLLRLTPAEAATPTAGPRQSALNGSYGIRMAEEYRPLEVNEKESVLPPPEEILLMEENVCLLDMAEWRTDDGPWQPLEEMLRIGVAAKERLGISTAAVSGAQPWALPPEKPEHTLHLRIRFRSEIALGTAYLALEDRVISDVRFNGQPIGETADGWFTDASIGRYPIGPVPEGVNTVEISKPIAASTSVENCFLLGDFGVRVTGEDIAVIPPPRSLAYGDWTTQGLPFYSGPLTYRYHLKGGRNLRLRLGLFSAPCVTAELDGQRVANLSLSPSEADLGALAEGEHVLDVTVYPSRINSFGPFHLNDRSVIWYGASAWRSGGMRWSRTYHLTPTGLLSEPHVVEY